MKLLRLIHSLDPAAGGPVQGIQQLTPLLAARGVSTTVVSLDDRQSPWLASEVTTPLGYTAHGFGPGRGVYGYRRGVVNSLQRLLAQADVMVIHGVWQYHAFAAWRASRRLGPAAPPYWVFPHGMLDPWFKRTYPIKHLKKWLYWPWADYRVLRDATAVCFTSDQERTLARQSFWLYSARELVVPYGVQFPPGSTDSAAVASQRQAFEQRFPALRGQRLILCLARLHAKKGLDLLLRAFAPLARQDPQLHLMIAGPANGTAGAALHAQLLDLARREGLERQFHLPGLLQAELKWGALHSAELFALPSHQENFGIAVVEALACGLPVLISTAVNICTEVRNAGAGLVQADTLAETHAALARWQAMPPAERATMASAAARLFRERYELSSNAGRLLRLLEATSLGSPLSAL